MERKIMVEGLYPAKITKTECGYDAEVWNRTYKLSKYSIIESIVSGGTELLSSPIRIVGKENNNPIVWDIANEMVDSGRAKIVKMSDNGKVEKNFILSTQSDKFILNTQYSIDYDGFIKFILTVMPKGRAVSEEYIKGMVGDIATRTLDEFWLEIPIKKEVAKFYNYLPCKNADYHHIDNIENETIPFAFASNMFIGNDDVGICVMFDSDKNWVVNDEKRAVECVVCEDEVILRYHLIDRDPPCWETKSGGNNSGRDMLPIVFEFGIQATPVKPFPKNPFKEHNIHIDCFKKVFIDYESFLFEKKAENGETMMDRIERLGVDTLYLHEKWNDIQNSVDLTEEAENRLKHIVDEAHKRGIKVIPYFGYEISTLSPLFSQKYDEYRQIPNEYHLKKSGAGWYRYPWQRDPWVCYCSDYGDYFLNGIDRLMQQFGFDGVYLDGTFKPIECINEKHGCGYRDEDNNLHPTYNMWKIRAFAEKLYEIVHRHGGIINLHASECMQSNVMAFVDSIWDGEVVQTPQLLAGEIDEMPESRFRCAYTGRNMGVPVYMLCYSNPPQWTFHSATASALAYGILPKPVDIGEPLEEMYEIHKVYDAFPMDDAKWMPFFKNSVIVEKDEIRVSYFENGNKILAIVANMKNAPSGNVRIKFPFDIRLVKNAMTGDSINCQDRTISVSFEKFDYVLLNIEK